MKFVVDTNIAFSAILNTQSKIGDKELMKGLAKKGYTNFITTEELFNLRSLLES
jgi:predicted nucleic acid-binding protein